MTILAYFDVRPFLFIGGLPLFIGLALLVCWLAAAALEALSFFLASPPTSTNCSCSRPGDR